MLISVIIPAYNTDLYIDRCLDCVCSQTYKDIEILIVNDGSTDRTPQIIEEYAKRDGRIRVFTHTQNQGNGIGRNMAIREAKGEYVMFVDSDDYISKDAITKLANCLDGNLPDVVLYGYNMYSQNKKGKEKLIHQFLPEISGNESKELLMNMILAQQKGFTFAPWVYLCRREFLLENDIMFDESGRYFEDNIFTTKIVFYVNRLFVLKEALYYYILRDNSIMGSTSKKKINDRIEAVINIKGFLKSKSILDKCRDAYTLCFVRSAFYLPFMDYVRLKEKDEQIQKFFYELSQNEAIKTFNARGLNLPNEVRDKKFNKRCNALTSNVWLISHHFNFSLRFFRFFSKK